MVAYNYPPPSEEDSESAREATAKIMPLVSKKMPLIVHLLDEEPSHRITLPPGAVSQLKDILEAMAAGRGITLIPQQAELTTGEAAAILNVSRPYLIKLLEAGEIPYHKVGKHRRILMEDLILFKDKSQRQSRAAMQELVALSEDLGLYDL